MNKRAFIMFVAVLVVVVVAVLIYTFVFSAHKAHETVYTDFVIKDPFIVNVYDNYSVLRTGIVLILNTDDKAVISMLEAKLPQIRDTLISAMRAIDISVLSSPAKYDEVKRTLTDALNGALTGEDGNPLNVVHGIYFTDYYVQ